MIYHCCVICAAHMVTSPYTSDSWYSPKASLVIPELIREAVNSVSSSLNSQGHELVRPGLIWSWTLCSAVTAVTILCGKASTSYSLKDEWKKHHTSRTNLCKKLLFLACRCFLFIQYESFNSSTSLLLVEQCYFLYFKVPMIETISVNDN